MKSLAHRILSLLAENDGRRMCNSDLRAAIDTGHTPAEISSRLGWLVTRKWATTSMHYGKMHYAITSAGLDRVHGLRPDSEADAAPGPCLLQTTWIGPPHDGRKELSHEA